MWRYGRRLVFAAMVVCCIESPVLGAPKRHVLRNSLLRVVVDLETGGIAEIRDLRTPDAPVVFPATDAVLRLSAGEFLPTKFLVTGAAPNAVTISAATFQSPTGTLPLSTTIRYNLTESRLAVDYQFEATGLVNLDHGLDVTFSSSSWDTMDVRNQYSGEEPFVFSRQYVVRYFALNQRYELRNSLRNLDLVFPNPFQSMVTVGTGTSRSFVFTWHVLPAVAPIQAVEPKGPPLASVLAPGVTLHRQIELIVSHGQGATNDYTSPVAYFSPYPNGYDQVIAMTFDDIPFYMWLVPQSGHDTTSRGQQYLLRLLEDHPEMKMGWVVLPDAILTQETLETPGYVPGEWWTAHGTRRILTDAPEEYRTWLRTIDRDSVVLGYEHRVHLGSHGYHHTPEMQFGANFEFQSYDTTMNDSTFAAIVDEYSSLGLSARSRKWIRFPGFYFTRATIDALIKYGFVLFDYWGIYDKLPWMLFYSEHGRIWGIGTYWEGDTPKPYSVMDKILGAGKLCHTAGHPWLWFDWGGDSEAAYQQIDDIFQQAETNYPNLGYMFPDEVGLFADETYDIHSIETDSSSDSFFFSFVGSAASGQTVEMEWLGGNQEMSAVTIDGLRAPQIERRGKRLVIWLPTLSDGPHVVQVTITPTGVPAGQVGHSPIELMQGYPNPFNAETFIGYRLPGASHVHLAVYDVRGERVAVLEDNERPEGFHTVRWNGRDTSGRKVASGIYFCRLEAGGATAVRRLIILR